MLPPIIMNATVCPRLTEVSNFIATLAQRGSIVVMITVVMVNLLPSWAFKSTKTMSYWILSVRNLLCERMHDTVYACQCAGIYVTSL